MPDKGMGTTQKNKGMKTWLCYKNAKEKENKISALVIDEVNEFISSCFFH